ncbi:unnamed protein product [Ascophyllum nodosum]
MTERCLKDGEVLVKEGQPMPALFLIESGELERVRRPAGDSDEQAEQFQVDRKEAGTATGLLHVLKFGEACLAFATVRAHGEAKVWSLKAKDLESMLRDSPEFAMSTISSLAADLRGKSKARQKAALAHLIRSDHGKVGGKNFEGIKVMCYGSTGWVRENFQAKADKHNETSNPKEKIMVHFTSDTLSASSAVSAVGYDAVCLFVNDIADAEVLKTLGSFGVGMVALRCAGFDKVDTDAAQALGLTVARVPAYSPYAVAEHAIALLMALNRKVHRAATRTKDANFSLDGLVGFDLHGKTVAVVGCGRIGQCLCNILLGFGVKLLCVEEFGPVEDLVQRGAKFVEIDEAWKEADVVFLQIPLLPSTKHIFNEDVLPKLKKGMILINTSRGGLVNTEALIKGIRSGAVGMAGLDVYEHEAGYFFRDCSQTPVQAGLFLPLGDQVLAELLSLNNVLLTGHQAFFTQEAINGIVDATFANIADWRDGAKGKDHKNSVY